MGVRAEPETEAWIGVKVTEEEVKSRCDRREKLGAGEGQGREAEVS